MYSDKNLNEYDFSPKELKLLAKEYVAQLLLTFYKHRKSPSSLYCYNNESNASSSTSNMLVS